MLDFLISYGIFLLKTLTLLVVFLLAVGGLLFLLARSRESVRDEGQIEITHLSDELDDYQDLLLQETLTSTAYKVHKKAEKKADKERAKVEKKALKRRAKKLKTDEGAEEETEPRLFVVYFEGDIEATEVENLRECITAILGVANGRDQVLVVIESAGGYVHSYGLASAQLERLRSQGIPLTVAVDGIAASGGYMMACVANTIIAAPFAVIGSIGVIAELPNFHRLLKKHDVDYELHTAGKYKRTLSVMGENTEPLRRKFVEELEDVHTLFKNHVAHYRGEQCDINHIATGEHWHGIQALELGLVDKLQVSDDYILSFHQKGKGKVYQIEYTYPESWIDKLSTKFGLGLSKLGDKLWRRWMAGRYSKAI